MVEKLIANPADNLRRWHGAACDCAKCGEARRADYLARIKAEVEAGTYPEAANLDASLDKLQAAIDAVKTDVDPDDAVEHYERFE
jgi:hypothetical protein